jgi:hypothetical protein
MASNLQVTFTGAKLSFAIINSGTLDVPHTGEPGLGGVAEAFVESVPQSTNAIYFPTLAILRKDGDFAVVKAEIRYHQVIGTPAGTTRVMIRVINSGSGVVSVRWQVSKAEQFTEAGISVPTAE